MSVTVSCKTCGRELRSSDEYAGWPVKCPDCGAVNRLPEQPDQAPPEPEAAEQAPPEVCRLCGEDFSDRTDRAKDTKGQVYHRSCYEAERRRRAVSQAPARQPAPEPTGPPATQPSDLSEPLTDDLWDEFDAGVNSQPETLLAGTPVFSGTPSSQKQAPWFYAMIGVGLAVPVLLLLIIGGQMLFSGGGDNAVVTRSDPAPDTPTPAPDRTPGAPATPTDPEFPVPPGPDSDMTTPPETNYPPSPADVDPGIARGPTAPGNFGFNPVALLVVFAILLLIGALILRLGCSVCQVEVPNWGKAVGVVFVVNLATTAAQWLFGQVFGTAAGLLAVLVYFSVTAVAYSAMLKISFGKGILIAIVQIVIGVLLVVILMFCCISAGVMMSAGAR